MVTVKLKAFSIFSDIFGREEILNIDGRISVKDLIDHLKKNNKIFAETIKQIPVIILVNGKSVSEEYVLKENDEVAIIPPASGG